MDRKTLMWCTAAIILTLIGCAYWVESRLDNRLGWIERAVEH